MNLKSLWTKAEKQDSSNIDILNKRNFLGCKVAENIYMLMYLACLNRREPGFFFFKAGFCFYRGKFFQIKFVVHTKFLHPKTLAI